MSKRIALIDGYGFVFRAYHSLPPLNRADGTPVGAVYGFTNMLIKLLAGLDVTHMAVVFDSGSKTFRNDIFPQYKANRPPCPEDLKPQFPIIRQTAESLNLHILEKVGFEADDIIATYSKKAAAEGYEVLIISSDKDLMQLVDERISMYDAMKNKFIRNAEVKEKFMVEPDKVLDVLSLMGDSSDNVPGVKGIGPKTAAELIQQFGSLENIFKNLDQIKQEKRRQLLSEGEQNALLSKKLISLDESVDLGISISELEVKSLNPHKLLSFLQAQGFNSLVTRFKKEFAIDEIVSETKNIAEIPTKKIEEETSFEQIKRTEISSEEILDSLKKEALANGIVTIDFSSTFDFLTFSTCKKDHSPKEVFYVELKNETKQEQPNDLFGFSQKAPQIKKDFQPKITDFAEIFLNDSIKKIFFDFKNFLRLTTDDLRLTTSFDDLSLINHLLNSATRQDLRNLITVHLGSDFEEKFGEIFNELEKEREVEAFKDLEKKAEFFCFRNFAIYQLYQILLPKIFEQKLNQAYNSYELPLLEVLAQIELNGIKIDVEKLHQLSTEFGKKINELSTEIFTLAGCEFNIASPKQLGEILFEKLGLESGKKSKKTGALSTGAAVLEELAEQGNEIAKKILDFRKFSKLKNTYTDALPKEINSRTNRIHTTLSSISTVTGRLSSNNPNLQNIPIKSAEGKRIRECFIAEKNHLLISADYSQIELRVIAHVAKMPSLIAAFKEGKDIHKITASQVFGVPENEVDDSLRSKAKAINFGIIYGISAFGLARGLDISRQDAANYIKSYLETYPGIDIYMKNFINFARENGYVQTISGRKCFIHEINNKNPIIRNEAERLAINAPIQGSAADIIKKAMINLSKKFHELKMASKIILQVHDELIVESPLEEVENAKEIIRKTMENAFMMDTPLKIDLEVNQRWS
jgi:DNA polymerase-1